jgi:capsular exopolysaccharide synthesis family protein
VLIAGLAVAVGMGFGAGLLRENYIGGFTSAEQIESVTGTRFLAEIPRVKAKDPQNAVFTAPISSFSESIRRVRVGLEGFARESGLCVLITSAEPGEGKSSIALAYARSCAQAGRSTVLIDADLRNASIRRLADTALVADLTDFLTRSDAASIADLFLKEQRTGLSLILTNPGQSVAPDVLLASERFRSLVAYARENFDTVVIDSPPVGVVVDAQLLREFADVVLFVVKWAKSSQQRVASATRAIRGDSGVHVCSVLNQADTGAIGGYYYGH